ncbi:hypothetical protein ACJX0J_031300 [Zea mays]
MRVLVVSPYILCMHVLLPLRVLVVSPYIPCMQNGVSELFLWFNIQSGDLFFNLHVGLLLATLGNKKRFISLLLFELGKITETEASFAVQKSIKESRAILHIINYSKFGQGIVRIFLATSFKACMHHLTFINMVQMVFAATLGKRKGKKYYLEARSGDCCLISVEPTRMFFPYFFSIITLLGTHC